MLRRGNLFWNHGTVIFSLRRMVYAMVFLAWPAFASTSISLTWKPSADSTVAGYRIYYGVASHAYVNSVNVGNVTKATIPELAAKTTYYFAATTYDVYGNESDFSNEAMLGGGADTPPPPPPTKPPKSPKSPKPSGPPPNPPSIDPVGDLSAYFLTTEMIRLTGITNGVAGGKKLKITAVSSNPKLVASPKAKYSSTLGYGTLTIKPVANTNATVRITITLDNGALSNNITTTTFSLTIKPAIIASKAVQPVSLNNPAMVANSVSKSTPPGETSLAVSAPMPATLTPAPSEPGQFALFVSGVTNQPCVVQASTDLLGWVPVQTNTAPFTFVDSNASQFRQRFYRAASLPLP